MDISYWNVLMAHMSKFEHRLINQFKNELMVIFLSPLPLFLLNMWVMTYGFRPIAIAVTGGYLQHLIMLCLVCIPLGIGLLSSRDKGKASINLNNRTTEINLPAMVIDLMVSFPCLAISYMLNSSTVPAAVAYSSDRGYYSLLQDTSGFYIRSSLWLEQSFWVACYRLYFRLGKDYYIFMTYGPEWLRN